MSTDVTASKSKASSDLQSKRGTFNLSEPLSETERTMLRRICSYIETITGNTIPDRREAFALTNLRQLANANGLSSLQDIFIHARSDQRFRLQIVDALTVHETFFMRGSENFDLLVSELLPELRRNRPATKPISIWCVPCSSGQEALSIAMVLLNTGTERPGQTFALSASDISPKMMEQCYAGHYSEFEISRGMTAENIARWFTKTETGYEVAPELRKSIHWFQHNLLSEPPAFNFQDVIYCRNFWYYLNPEAKRIAARNISERLAPDGALIVSGTESLDDLEMYFTRSERHNNLYHPTNGLPNRSLNLEPKRTLERFSPR